MRWNTKICYSSPYLWRFFLTKNFCRFPLIGSFYQELWSFKKTHNISISVSSYDNDSQVSSNFILPIMNIYLITKLLKYSKDLAHLDLKIDSFGIFIRRYESFSVWISLKDFLSIVNVFNNIWIIAIQYSFVSFFNNHGPHMLPTRDIFEGGGVTPPL